MNTKTISNAEMLRKFIKKNETFISWLHVVAKANCYHVGYDNADTAEELIERLKEENNGYLELLTEMADKKTK